MKTEKEIREGLAHWENVLKRTTDIINSSEKCSPVDTSRLPQCMTIIHILKWVLEDPEEHTQQTPEE